MSYKFLPRYSQFFKSNIIISFVEEKTYLIKFEKSDDITNYK